MSVVWVNMFGAIFFESAQNPECPIRRDKVTNHLHVREIQYRTNSDSWLFFPDVISRLKGNLCQNL